MSIFSNVKEGFCMIKENLEYIKSNMDKSIATGEHSVPFPTLIAVSKTIGVPDIQEAVDLGAIHLGENRVQELVEKYDSIRGDVSWHLIGHLQTNKVKYIIDKVKLIHSLDRMELALEIEKRAARANLIMPCLVQVNVAEEDSKFGLKVDEVLPFIREVSKLPHVAICGLMTVGPIVDEMEDIRPVFRELRELRDRIKAENIAGVSMEHLSMGMTGDYMIAVEEGATLIRVGSGVFGRRTYK